MNSEKKDQSSLIQNLRSELKNLKLSNFDVLGQKMVKNNLRNEGIMDLGVSSKTLEKFSKTMIVNSSKETISS